MDVEQIAKRLTKAQREAMAGERSLRAGAGMWGLRSALARKGLVSGSCADITPLGLAVRAHLLASRGKA